jgi:transcriptional regulator with PAS, ATPase and Fis domain
VVAATNRRLDDEVRSGRFREDLRFRLDVFSVELPPLRQRMGDLEPLAEYLLVKLAEKYQRKKPLIKALDFEALRSYHFPGNVRELRNLLERSLLRTPEESATLILDLNWLKASRPPSPGLAVVTPPSGARSDLTPIEQQEYQLIKQALQTEGGGIRRAAARLGLTHQALLRRLQKWPELRQEIPLGRH